MLDIALGHVCEKRGTCEFGAEREPKQILFKHVLFALLARRVGRRSALVVVTETFRKQRGERMGDYASVYVNFLR